MDDGGGRESGAGMDDGGEPLDGGARTASATTALEAGAGSRSCSWLQYLGLYYFFHRFTQAVIVLSLSREFHLHRRALYLCPPGALHLRRQTI